MAILLLSGFTKLSNVWCFIICVSYYDVCRIIYAFDKDPLRYETLLKMIEKSGASCIVPKLLDFLKVRV